MFHPVESPMERGWVGRVSGDQVVHLAAQTLQSFFLGGGGAREHAVYPLEEVVLLPPVLHPPTVRIFEQQGAFAFANASAVVGPGATVGRGGALTLLPRMAVVVGAEGAVGGFMLLGEWRDRSRPQPKDRDFALASGPLVVTADELDLGSASVITSIADDIAPTEPAPPFAWERALALAADGTTLRPGDLVAGPSFGQVEVPPGVTVALSADGLGVLSTRTSAAVP
jgi:hypothetical protein